MSGDVESVKLLLSKGAEIEAKNLVSIKYILLPTFIFQAIVLQ